MNRYDIIKQLLKCEIDINQQDSFGLTALIYAVKNTAIRSINTLIQGGADLNIIDNCNMSALAYAIIMVLKALPTSSTGSSLSIHCLA